MYKAVLDFETIHGTTSGEDIFKGVENAIDQKTFDGKAWDLLQLLEASCVINIKEWLHSKVVENDENH